MPQDHTLFEILGHTDISVWKVKADWIEEHSGLVLINVHPDYMDSPGRLVLYEEFLAHMKKQRGMWHALPRDVARWWRERDGSSLVEEDRRLVVKGPAAGRATVIKTTLENGILKDEWVDEHKNLSPHR